MIDDFVFIEKLRNEKLARTKEDMLVDHFLLGTQRIFLLHKLLNDPTIYFGLTKVAYIESEDESGSFSFEDFLKLCNKLSSSKRTEYKWMINESASECPSSVWNQVYRRILLKDFDLGAEPKTFNKVVKKLKIAYPEILKYSVPNFSVLKAKSFEKEVPECFFLEPCYEGKRMLVLIHSNIPHVLAYENNKPTKYSDLLTSLHSISKYLPGAIVLDCYVNNKEIYISDLIPYEEFRINRFTTKQIDRHFALVALQESGVLRNISENLHVCEKIWVDRHGLNTKELEEFQRNAKEFFIKDADAPYEVGSSSNWLKVTNKIIDFKTI